MTNGVRRIKKVARNIDKTLTTFNNNLPISISVLEETYNQKYKLLLGNKEITARSKKKLLEGHTYWGDLNSTNDGILSISDLIIKPKIFNSNLAFMEIEKDIFFKTLIEQKTPFQEIKRSIIKKMSSDETTKDEFLTLGYMLLAFEKGVFHMPAIINARKVLLQFRENSDKNIEFYLAFENFGAIKGIIASCENIINVDISAMFEKSLRFIKQTIEDEEYNVTFCIDKNIEPLFNSSEMLLDIKG
ncbi:MAG: hypothetical protein GXP61_03135 [Epsilonproteobacteria bacterium]|nr:hypothetical protein [Campylobacterota bacterium]